MLRTRFYALVAMTAALLMAAPAWAQEGSTTTPGPQLDSYRSLSGAEFRALERVSGFDAGDLLGCVEGAELGRRETWIEQRVPFIVLVDGEGVLTVRYTGEEDVDATPDDDESVQGCMDEKVEEQELEPLDDDRFTLSNYSWIWYDATYASMRRHRHSEIIALYTLSGVSLGTGIGALVAAGNDNSSAGSGNDGSDFSSSRSDRSRRFKRAGWTMIGVSAVSFIAADILLIQNRRIERRENPYWAAAPVGPDASLGFSLSTRF
ncbi:MAG: hypothetical protein ACJA1R_002322 [Flavobacteriales bacterium]|jgi:hypothetical protein